MTKPFFEDEYAVIEFDETIPCVKVTLKGVPRGSDHYQLVQTKRLELMAQEIKNYPKLHMLTDSTTAGPVLDEDITHFRDEVMPAMEKAGVRYLAIVVPTNKFTQLTIREMTQDADVMKVRYFETLRDAKQWLRRMTVL
ncbi:MAG: STAS/SEC14 domain-containing protein [Chryseolinea sp.]